MKTHIDAELFVVPESEGGRRSPFFSGYRPQFFFDGVHNGCVITIIGGNEMAGGDAGLVTLTFFQPKLQYGRLSVGDAFCIAEGARVVCRGTIKRIHVPEMIRAAPD